MKNKYILLIILVFSIPHNLFSQPKSKGDILFEKFAYKKAVYQYEKSLIKGDSSVLRKLAKSYQMIHDYQNALNTYELLVKQDNHTNEDVFNYAEMLKANGKMQKSLTWMQKYVEDAPLDDPRSKKIQKSTDYLKEINTDKGHYQIENLPFNTAETDYAPTIYKEGEKKKVLFVSSRERANAIQRKDGWTGKLFHDFFIADVEGLREFDHARWWDVGLNSKENEGPATFSSDGKEVYYTKNTTYKKNKENISMLEIVNSKKVDGEWSKPEKVSFDDSDYLMAHPSLSHDGKTLYFSSNKEGGFGKMDIYKVNKQDNGHWGTPINLGEKVNSIDNETFPFIHPSGILFFASDGHAGLGGMDLFAAKTHGDEIVRVQNLGKPLNSPKDDFGITMEEEMKTGYFSSNRDGGQGEDDIYFVRFRKEVTFDTKLTIVAKDSETDSSLSNFHIIVKNIDNELKEETTSDTSISFFLLSGKSYIITASKEAYNNHTQNIELGLIDTLLEFSLHKEVSLETQVKKHHIDTTVVEVQSIVKIEDKKERVAQIIEQNIVTEHKTNFRPIYYRYNNHDITEEASGKAKIVADYLKAHPEKELGIYSYTDCRGDDNYNKALSHKRATSIKNHLIFLGIKPDRIKVYAKGEVDPVARCYCEDDTGIIANCTDEEYIKSRRSEFVIR